ncbi:cryptochrome/deoxyribodipyrimidine photo-lyase family protein [Chitinibacter sp. ZOR0017]|uniref:cryptochrome/deoxyribodipyrimidine photo-lyase family protein n=1 Tax=Chitinibacter sp. ZOR0017 TaxID=1339254 RepID=UPI00068F0958|nr:deoxyribodipyrimidine photo-lyase [Chitinibacter sp. ZOR0017]
MPVHVVWLKKDLRLHDHWPLWEASQRGPVVVLYCQEPSLQAQPDYSAGHWAFTRECLAELAHDLARAGLRLYVYPGEVVPALQALRQQVALAGLYSHEETGNLASFARDRAVAAWCRAAGVPWQEWPQNGVVRRLANRDHWQRHWQGRMVADPAPKLQWAQDATLAAWPSWPVGEAGTAGDFWADTPAQGQDFVARQSGGRRAAVNTLQAFLLERGGQYRGGISSPLKAVSACSRLSPYLSFGCLSLREVVQATRRRAAQLKAEAPSPTRWTQSLRSFESRLHWHCHFMQKLESEPALEQFAQNPAYLGLRENQFNPAYFQAWAAGETGYPLVDACMAMLRHTGWINFRMRAMLVSFASYNLWLHWPQPAAHLARLFLDYEPGIHYPQVQMQSGVTGINTLRIYNPIKQAQEHDPRGAFVRHWLPPLRRVPDWCIFEPWLMPEGIQREAGCMLGRDYPWPVVEWASSMQLAKQRISDWRRSQPHLRELSQAVYQKHGSRQGPAQRRSRRSGTAKAPPAALQADLFAGGLDAELALE